MSADTTPANPTKLFWVGVPENSIIEWTAFAPITSGGVDTSRPVRRTGRVIMVKPEYLLVQPADAFFATSRARIYSGTPVTVIAERAEAGWGNL